VKNGQQKQHKPVVSVSDVDVDLGAGNDDDDSWG
jgi:hypothetical protein